MSLKSSGVGSFLLIVAAVLTILMVHVCDCAAGPPTRQAGSGTFDMSNIDCDNLDDLDPRFRRMAERRCAENKPNYTISNARNVDSEPTPADVYGGKDKKNLKKMVMEAWSERWPDDEVLGIRFHMKEWKRDANYKANSTSIYKNDTSVLAVSVVVKDSASTATIFMAYLNKDNLDGSLNAGVDTKKSDYVVKQMLLKNWKG